MNVLSCGLLWAKSVKHFGDYGRHFPTRRTQKSSQHVRACATGDGALCSKNRKIVPYHGDSPSSRICARLRSPSLIITPGVAEAGTLKLVFGTLKRRSPFHFFFLEYLIKHCSRASAREARPRSTMGKKNW